MHDNYCYFDVYNESTRLADHCWCCLFDMDNNLYLIY